MANIAKVHSYDEESISFYNLEMRVLQIPFTDMNRFQEVLDYIKAPIDDDDENRNIYLARSIVRFMFLVPVLDNLPLLFFPELLQPSFSATFCYMCSRLDIPCRIIEGRTKDFTSYRYETYPAEWCAFMSNGDWHLVDLDGLLSATTYYETEGHIILESEGETILEEQEQVEGQSLVVFNDFWFCTKPNILVSFDFPNEQQWLLLDSPKDPGEFPSMLFTYIHFHLLGLQFLTENSSKLCAKDGRCTISLKADPSIIRSNCFPYTLGLFDWGISLSKNKLRLQCALNTYCSTEYSQSNRIYPTQGLVTSGNM